MTDQKRLTEPEREVWKMFLAVATVLNHRVEQQLKDNAGLSHSQYEVLARLSDAPNGELRMTELAGIALTSKSGLSYQVTQLEKAGLVHRRRCETDDRGIVAALTEEGWAKLRATAPAHLNLVHELFVEAMDKKELAGLKVGIEALAAHLGPAS
jgi:DNA-binding MarR family transcriptional regulator